MPKKSASAAQSETGAEKPKRKYARKKAVPAQPQETEEKEKIQNEPKLQNEPQSESRHEPQSESRPEPQSEPHNHFHPDPISEKDAAFLAPSSNTFGLKPKIHIRTGKQPKFLRAFIWSLSIIIILAAVGLFAIAANPSRPIFGHGGFVFFGFKHNPKKASSLSSAKTPQASSGPAKLVVVNAPPQISPIISSIVTQTFGDKVAIDNPSNLVSLPAENSDTLFFKSSAQAQAQNLIAALAKYNIKPQIQNSENISDDMDLYLVSVLPGADLSATTASVYNATNVSGLAKKYCGYLAKYKVSSCNALNAPKPQSAITVFYKNQALLPVLVRLQELQKAVFRQADSSQVEDIKVVVGS